MLPFIIIFSFFNFLLRIILIFQYFTRQSTLLAFSCIFIKIPGSSSWFNTALHNSYSQNTRKRIGFLISYPAGLKQNPGRFKERDHADKVHFKSHCSFWMFVEKRIDSEGSCRFNPNSESTSERSVPVNWIKLCSRIHLPFLAGQFLSKNNRNGCKSNVIKRKSIN